MVKCPPSVKIAGQRYKITFEEKPVVEELGLVQGYCSNQESQITIRKSVPMLEVDTLIHEILHAIEYKWGLAHNEHYVNRFATGLAQVFKDNPKILQYITERLKEEK